MFQFSKLMNLSLDLFSMMCAKCKIGDFKKAYFDEIIKATFAKYAYKQSVINFFGEFFVVGGAFFIVSYIDSSAVLTMHH